MPTVSPSQSNSGDTIEAADINTPVNQLAAVINGNIDGTNIAANAIGNAQIASAGIYTTKVYNPYKFNVYRSAAFVTSSGAVAVTQYDTRNFDTSSNVDITTNKGRFTAPVSGFYFIEGSCSVTTTTAVRLFCTIYKNGSPLKRGNDANLGSGNIYCSQVVSLIQLAANDYIEIYNFTSASQTGSTGQDTSFSGYLVSAT